jgi:hypothetical protein
MQTAEPAGELASARSDKVSRNRDRGALRLAAAPCLHGGAQTQSLCLVRFFLLSLRVRIRFDCAQSPSSRFRFYEEQLALADENLMQAKEVWSATLEGEN